MVAGSNRRAGYFGGRGVRAGRASVMACAFALLLGAGAPAIASKALLLAYGEFSDGRLPSVVGVNAQLERRNYDYDRAIALATQASAESVRFDAT